MKVCMKCGAAVVDTTIHDHYHFHRGDRTDLSEMGLPTRMHNALRRGGILDVETFLYEAEAYPGGLKYFVGETRNVGAKTFEQSLVAIDAYLAAHPFYKEVLS